MSPRDAQGPKAPPRKRRRVVISCTECHRRKQKCDRDVPCGNCKSRNKESACYYEPAAQNNTKKASQSPDGEADEPLSAKAVDWGYAQNGASTIGLLRKIEAADGEDALDGVTRGSGQDDFLVREKYKGLIRQLPAKVYIDKLIDMYMRGFNWQYYPVDPDVFRQQLEEWNSLSFSVLSNVGPQGLSPELRAFPALLFQVIGTALLLLEEGTASEFDALKYAGNMRFEDLGIDYSESGAAIVELLGKKHLSLVTVQAQFLRASFLKFTAKVAEAWHTISMAIKDAQELGMHRDSLDPKPKDASIARVLENQWLIQRRRKMYTLLAVWDLNCAMVLGLPGTIDWNQDLPTPPIDASVLENRSKAPVIPRNEEKEPPTPITRILWNRTLCGPLRDIQNLEKEGAYPKSFAKIDKIQQEIRDLDERIPPVFRLENPDTRWDDGPDMYWLPGARYYFAQLHQFGMMALHRPYVFHRKESRSEALKASLAMLEIQKLTFDGLPPDTWRNHLLFFGSFDAIVLIASIYIFLPSEHPELVGTVLQHFQWTIGRFLAMQDRNPLAKSAQGVLRAIVARFKKAISSVESTSSETPASEGRQSSGATNSTPASSLGTGVSYTYPQPSASSEWTVPSLDGLAGIAPMFPTGDLLYHDLNAFSDASGPTDAETLINTDDFAWQFGGDLGDDTLWQFLNQYQPVVGDALG